MVLYTNIDQTLVNSLHGLFNCEIGGLDCRSTDYIVYIEPEYMVLYTNIDQTLVNSLHGLLNCEIGGLDCHVITTEYRTRVHCIHIYKYVRC